MITRKEAEKAYDKLLGDLKKVKDILKDVHDGLWEGKYGTPSDAAFLEDVGGAISSFNKTYNSILTTKMQTLNWYDKEGLEGCKCRVPSSGKASKKSTRKVTAHVTVKSAKKSKRC